MEEKKYNTLVIDPPWPISMTGKTKIRPRRINELPYKTMSIQQIYDFKPCEKWANKGAHVYVWTTNKMMEETFKILKAWGVNFHLIIPWVKQTGIAPCFAYIFAAEYCILGFYGKPMQRFIGKGELNWLKAFNKTGMHSVKPAEFYAKVEKMSPGPRIDIFARRERKNWDVWGDEV